MRTLPVISSLIALLCALLTLPSPAAADGGQTNAVGRCVTDGNVWLLVVDENSDVLINECVGTPESGADALESTGVAVDRTDKGLLCSIGGHPDECPHTFTGQYWNYHHAEPGAAWTFADKGPNQRTPAPGSMEGWCYNRAEEEQCTPPVLEVVIDGEVQLAGGLTPADVTDIPVTNLAEDPGDVRMRSDAPVAWVAGAITALAVIGGAAFVVLRRRRAPGDTVGGR